MPARCHLAILQLLLPSSFIRFSHTPPQTPHFPGQGQIPAQQLTTGSIRGHGGAPEQLAFLSQPPPSYQEVGHHPHHQHPGQQHHQQQHPGHHQQQQNQAALLAHHHQQQQQQQQQQHAAAHGQMVHHQYQSDGPRYVVS